MILRSNILLQELRILDWWIFLFPWLIAALFVGVTCLMTGKHVNNQFLIDLVVGSVEACIPLIAGVAATALTAKDPALELLLTYPTEYRKLVFFRLGVLLVWTAFVELIATTILSSLQPQILASQKPLWLLHLTWIAPLLWWIALGALSALLLKSRAMGGAVVGSLWIIQLSFHGYFVAHQWSRSWFLFATLFSAHEAYWLANRLIVSGLALILFAITWCYLRNTERRFFGEEK
jgi:hypothetical protein